MERESLIATGLVLFIIIFAVLFAVNHVQNINEKKEMCQAFGFEHYDFGGQSTNKGVFGYGWIDAYCYSETYYCEEQDCVKSSLRRGYITQTQQSFYEKYGRPPKEAS